MLNVVQSGPEFPRLPMAYVKLKLPKVQRIGTFPAGGNPVNGDHRHPDIILWFQRTSLFGIQSMRVLVHPITVILSLLCLWLALYIGLRASGVYYTHFNQGWEIKFGGFDPSGEEETVLDVPVFAATMPLWIADSLLLPHYVSFFEDEPTGG